MPEWGCWRPSTSTAVRAVAVIVNVPDSDRGGAGISAVKLSGVEQFLGRDGLVSPDLSVVTWVYGLFFCCRVRWPRIRAVAGSIARPIVGNDPVDGVIPCAANRTLAGARNAAVDAPAAAVGILLSFFTSKCTMWPGQRVMIFPGLRVLPPQGSINLPLPRPSLARCRVTVRRLARNPTSESS